MAISTFETLPDPDISVTADPFGREGQDIAVEVAHERADGHFQLVWVATLFHEDARHPGGLHSTRARCHPPQGPLPRVPTGQLPPAGRRASGPAGAGVRPQPPRAEGPRRRSVRIVSLAYLSRRCGCRGHAHELVQESCLAEPWMVPPMRSRCAAPCPCWREQSTGHACPASETPRTTTAPPPHAGTQSGRTPRPAGRCSQWSPGAGGPGGLPAHAGSTCPPPAGGSGQ
jgi:hypothetical protein